MAIYTDHQARYFHLLYFKGISIIFKFVNTHSHTQTHKEANLHKTNMWMRL